MTGPHPGAVAATWRAIHRECPLPTCDWSGQAPTPRERQVVAFEHVRDTHTELEILAWLIVDQPPRVPAQ